MSLSDELRNAHQSAKTHEAICQSLIQENTRYREDIAMLTADNAELVFRLTRAVLDERREVARQCAEIVAKAEIEHFNAVGLPYVKKPQTPIANTIYKEFGIKEPV